MTRRTIRIDGEGDGRWIMDLVSGSFDDRYDHAFVAVREHEDESGNVVVERLGGFTTCNWLGRSIGVHMAGVDPRWCSPRLMWILFQFIFDHLKVRKALTTVASNHYQALDLDLRAGWVIETVIREAFPDADMVILSMTREQCRWLNPPQHVINGEKVGES